MSSSKEKQVEQEKADEQAVLAVLVADLPKTARTMNGAAITEEIELGRDTPQPEDDDDLPPQEIYDRHEAALKRLEQQGVLVSVEVFGFTAYAAKEIPDETWDEDESPREQAESEAELRAAWEQEDEQDAEASNA